MHLNCDNIAEAVVGIDLGTTFSCISIYENDTVKIIPDDNGSNVIPSWIAYINNEFIVGEPAKNIAPKYPSNVIFDIKRLIGRKYSDADVQQEINRMPYKIIKGDLDQILIEMTCNDITKSFTPEFLSAMILMHLKQTAIKYLNRQVTTTIKAVITVPAYFNDAQRQATKLAGTIAGLEVIRIINEPTAAAIAYGINEHYMDRNVVIFDLGGGTLDVSILCMDDGVFEVKSTNGNTHLGGSDFDDRLANYCFNDFVRKNKLHPPQYLPPIYIDKIMTKLKIASELAKIKLSSSLSVKLEIDISDSLNGTCDNIEINAKYSIDITRELFESLCGDLFRQILEPLENALYDFSPNYDKKIDDVILIGGSTKIPKIQNIIVEYFNLNSVDELCKSINSSLSLSEAVSCGAAIQGAILGGVKTKKLDEILLLDVVPLSLGLETSGSIMSVMIRRNTPIPAKKTYVFNTYSDNQTAVSIKVFEGERPFTRDCNLLGSFDLTGIRKQKQEQTQIEITYDVDSNGILTVSATEKSSDVINATNMTISLNKNRLSDDDVQRMIKEAKQHEEIDIMMKNKVESKEKLINSVHMIKKNLNDNTINDKFDENHRLMVHKKLIEVDQLLDKNTDDVTKDEYDMILKDLIKLFEILMNKTYDKVKISSEVIDRYGYIPPDEIDGAEELYDNMTPEERNKIEELFR